MTRKPWSPQRRHAARYSHKSRYEIVGQHLRSARGILLDVGARDRTLLGYLATGALTYQSADLDEGHDYKIDLEKPIDLADGSFDHVVALDVLEHVENIHGAFVELARITRGQLIVSLPNIAVVRTRFRFLIRGHLGGKYNFADVHPGDRHRWVTTHSSIGDFMLGMAAKTGLEPAIERNELIHAHRYVRGLALVAVTLGVGKRSGLLSERSILVFERATA